MIQDAYGNLAVDPVDSGFSRRFQEHFELETLGLEEPGASFFVIHIRCWFMGLAACFRVGRLWARQFLKPLKPTTARFYSHEVASRGYALKRAMEQVTIGVLEQLPLDTSSRSLIPGFRSSLKDLLDWREVLHQLERLPRIAGAACIETLWQSPAAGALVASERQEAANYQELTVSNLGDLLVGIEARPLVERAISN